MTKLNVLKHVQHVDNDSPYVDTLLIYGQGVSSAEVNAQLDIVKKFQSKLREHQEINDDEFFENTLELGKIDGIKITNEYPHITIKGLKGLSLNEIVDNSFEIDEIELF